MSYNKTLNAVIAFIEDRPEVAREILRSPEMEQVSISDVSARLYHALEDCKDKAIVEVLRKVLRKTMALTSKDLVYMQAVVDVEQIIEECLYEHASTNNQMTRSDIE